jgi:hypothetical protein
LLDFSQVNQRRYDVKQIREIVDSQLFTPEFCAHILTSLAPRMLVISAEDLEFWGRDPEGFCLEEDADHWQFKMRACVEKVVSVLFTTHKNGMAFAFNSSSWAGCNAAFIETEFCDWAGIEHGRCSHSRCALLLCWSVCA